MKRIFSILVIITVLMSFCVITYSFPHPPTQQDLQYNEELSKATKGIALFIGDKDVEIQMKQEMTYNYLNTPPVIQNDRTLIPLRFIAEEFNATVNWNESLQQVKISSGDKNIVLTIDKNIAEINGKSIQLEQPPVIMNGRTFVPLRFVSENVGIPVQWYDKSKAVIVGFDYFALKSKIYGTDIQKMLIDERWTHDDSALNSLYCCIHQLKDFETESQKSGNNIFNADNTVNLEFVNKSTLDFGWFNYDIENSQNNRSFDIQKFYRTAAGDIVYDIGGPGFVDMYGIHYHSLNDIKVHSLNNVLVNFKKRQGALAPNGSKNSLFDADTWFDDNGNIVLDKVEIDFRAGFILGANFYNDVDIKKFSKDSNGNIVYDINGTGVKDVSGKEYHSLNDYVIQ